MSALKERAGRGARKAIKQGLLTPKPCQVCAGAKVDAHHEDYTKPLNVVWLCRRHHVWLHMGHTIEQMREVLAEERAREETRT